MNGSFSSKKQIILHVDMDHFFSAIEEREHPEFKGRPVIVGADPKNGLGRGVVKTCNYEAREFGIHSGMAISKAWQCCPDAIYVGSNYKLYKEVSSNIMTILRRYGDRFQPWGFDEAFLDVTTRVEGFEEARQLAMKIKYDIIWNERLMCSVGVSSNKLVAKIASDYGKPDGLTVVKEGEAEAFLAPLSVRRMLGIGEKTERKLNEMGIRTIGDLAAFDVSRLIESFGVMGRRYHQWAHGHYESKVGHRKRVRKSMGHERTFIEDITDPNIIQGKLEDVCRRICEKAVDRNLLFRTVAIKIRYGNYETFTRAKTLSHFTNNLEELRNAVLKLSQANIHSDRTIRLVGVRVSNIKSNKWQQNLF